MDDKYVEVIGAVNRQIKDIYILLADVKEELMEAYSRLKNVEYLLKYNEDDLK